MVTGRVCEDLITMFKASTTYMVPAVLVTLTSGFLEVLLRVVYLVTLAAYFVWFGLWMFSED